jgi:hypothetical protein
MSVQIEDLRGIAQKVLDILGVIDYSRLQLTDARKTEGKWRVTFEYEHPHGFASSAIRKVASFVVDAKSEEIEGMWLDRAWK